MCETGKRTGVVTAYRRRPEVTAARRPDRAPTTVHQIRLSHVHIDFAYSYILYLRLFIFGDQKPCVTHL